jgi:quinol monooxygenase YgiN
MYGTIARIKTKPGAIDYLCQLSEKTNPLQGAMAEYIFQKDSDLNELWVVVVFENQESFRANAQDPDTHTKYKRILEWLVEEPEWHDGEIVLSRQY